MKLLSYFRNISEADKSKAVEKLITESTADFDFNLLVILSVLMATLGLLLDSTAILIGSMLIAPILYPVLSVSLGLIMSDHALIGRSLSTLIRSFSVGVGTAAFVALFFGTRGAEFTGEILARAEPSLAYFAVAVIAGVAVSYSLMRPDLNETFPGIVVSVALIPPLAVVGIGLVFLDWSVASRAFMLFVINIIGIVFASMVSFAVMDLYRKRGVAKETVKKEEARVEKEAAEVEALSKEA